jgi:Sulfotransferase domain
MEGTTRAGMRFAILSTPRSGNTWLRHLLGTTFAAPELAVHNPGEIDWASLPRDCILQLHWHRTAELQSCLQRHGFRLVVLARHPLDVLLSILHFALYDSSPKRWLEGENGDEMSIFGAMPSSAAFLRYATGARASALLSVSCEWWNHPEAYTVRYESLVGDTDAELTRFLDALGVHPCCKPADALAANSFSKLRSGKDSTDGCVSNHHFWQGKPGHWKRYFPVDVASDIAAAHSTLFRTLDYCCEPDPALDRMQAEANWIDANREELMDRLWGYLPLKQSLRQALETQNTLERQVAHLDAHCKERGEALAAADEQCRQLQSALKQLQAALEQTQAAHARMHTASEQHRVDLEVAVAEAQIAIKTLSAAPTQRMASMVKRLLRWS